MSESREPRKARHTQPPAKPAPEMSGCQLSGDDYENIWLRVKDRAKGTFWAAFFGALTLTTAFGGVGGYELAKRALESEVERYAKSNEFKKGLTEYTREQIPELQRELTALEYKAQTLDGIIKSHQLKIAALQRPPIEVDLLGARWTAPDGRSLRIQTGQAHLKSGQIDVTFATPFAADPVVMITLNDAFPAFGRGAVSTANVTASGMQILSHGVDGNVHWVAIGQ